MQVRGEEFPDGGEPFTEFWERVDNAWQKLIDFMDKDEECVVVVSSHSLVLGGLMGCCLGLDRRSIPMFRYVHLPNNRDSSAHKLKPHSETKLICTSILYHYK